MKDLLLLCDEISAVFIFLPFNAYLLARPRLHADAIVAYLAMPPAERSDSIDFVKSAKAMLRDVGLDE